MKKLSIIISSLIIAQCSLGFCRNNEPARFVDTFTAEAWRSPTLRRLLDKLGREAFLRQPAEFSLRDHCRSKRSASVDSKVYYQALDAYFPRGHETALKPIESYLAPRWTKTLLSELVAGNLTPTIVIGTFFEGLCVLPKDILPLVEVVPEDLGGHRLVLVWHAQEHRCELFLLGITSIDSVVHQMAMLRAAGLDESSLKIIDGSDHKNQDKHLEQALLHWKRADPDVVVIGFRDTLTYALAKRKEDGLIVQALQERFGKELGGRIEQDIENDLVLLPTLRNFVNAVKIASLTGDIVRSEFGRFSREAKNYRNRHDLIKNLRTLLEKGRPFLAYSPTIKTLRSIVSKDGGDDPVTVEEPVFLPHPDLELKAVDYHRSDGRKGSLILLYNPYGSQIERLLNAFNKRFPRAKIRYFGSAGSLSSAWHSGDLVRSPRGVPTFLKSVFSPVAQTKETLQILADSAVQLIDVEGDYLRRFLIDNPGVDLASVFLVSDEPLAEVTLADWQERRDEMGDSLQNMTDDLILSADIGDLTLKRSDFDREYRQRLEARKKATALELRQSISEQAIERAFSLERRDRLVRSWQSYDEISATNLSNLEIERAWRDMLEETLELKRVLRRAKSSDGGMSAIIDGKIHAFVDREDLIVEIRIRPQSQAAVKSIEAGLIDSASIPLSWSSASGAIVYAKGEQMLKKSDQLSLSYVPYDRTEKKTAPFLGDQGYIKYRFPLDHLDDGLVALGQATAWCFCVPADRNQGLVDAQVPAPWVGMPASESFHLPLTHKITRNYREVDREQKLKKDIALTIEVIKGQGFLSSRRQIRERRAREDLVVPTTSTASMEWDQGSGQDDLIYFSYGSGIDYHDISDSLYEKIGQVVLQSPRLVFKDASVEYFSSEYYPRNAYSLPVSGLDRYDAVLAFQASSTGWYREARMNLERRRSYLKEFQALVIENIDMPQKKAGETSFRFKNMSGKGSYRNNEVRIPGELAIAQKMICVLVPTGTSESYKRAFSLEKLGEALIIEAPSSDDSGMTSAYLRCLARSASEKADLFWEGASRVPGMIAFLDEVSRNFLLSRFETTKNDEKIVLSEEEDDFVAAVLFTLSVWGDIARSKRVVSDTKKNSIEDSPRFDHSLSFVEYQRLLDAACRISAMQAAPICNKSERGAN